MGDHSDLLDWTITDAPPPDEIHAPEATHGESAGSASHVEPRALSRRVWLLLGGMSALAVLATAFILWRSQGQMRAAVRQVITLEEQAARATDLSALTPLIDPQAAHWETVQTSWARRGQLSPLPDPALRATTDIPSVIRSITQIATDTVRAEVARVFSAPDGARYTFLFAQYYRYADGQWWRTDIPEGAWGNSREYLGQRLTLDYPNVDQAFAAELGPFVDAVLQRACAEWACSPDLILQMRFQAEAPSIARYLLNPLSPDEPLVLAHLRTASTPPAGDTLTFPSPFASGLPADEASAEWLKRSVAVQALMQLAVEINGTNQRDNAYLYALVARFTARWGMETVAPEAAGLAPTLYFPEELWDLAFAGLWTRAPLRGEAVRGALAQVNQILSAPDAPADLAQRLFRALRNNFSASAWAAEGLRLSPDTAANTLSAIALSTFQLKPPTAQPDVVFSCPSGPLLYSLADDTFTPLWRASESERGAYLSSWSPNGQWLTLNTYNTMAGFNLLTGEMRVLPAPTAEPDPVQLWPQAWASDAVLAYTVTSWTNSGQYNSTMLLADLNNPQFISTPITDVVSYLPAPDGTLAAIATQTADGPQLSLMPALGGPRTVVGPSTNAYAWSPDSRTLTYLTHDDQALRLFGYDVAAQTNRLLWQTALGASAPAYSTIAYSPDGQLLLFMTALNDQMQVNLVYGNGVSETWQLNGHYISTPVFSADGTYWAATLYTNDTLPRTVVYETASQKLIWDRFGVWGFVWATAGAEMVTFSESGVSLYADPRAEPRRLVEENCYNGLWRPIQ